MTANAFCGVFVFEGAIAREPWTDFRERHRQAAHSLAPAAFHKVEFHETGELLLAACAFDAGNTPLRRLADTVGVVAGDPVWCPSDGPATDLETASDALINTLVANGSRGPQSARGNFAAIAFDALNRRISLSTDKLGIRPVYFALMKDRVVFATTLAATIRMLGRRPPWNEQGLAETLCLGQCFRDRTPYADVYCLLPGEVVTFDAGGKIDRRRYFDLTAAAGEGPRGGDLEAQVQDAFATAIARRSREKVEYAFLSGGMDSRAVVDALIDLGREVRSFGSSFEKSIDDIVSVDAAHRLGINHFRHVRKPADRLQYNMDQYAIYARDSFPPMSRQGPKAMWSGDGGSVTLGHVYMTADRVNRAGSAVTPEMIRALFPQVALERPSRHLTHRRARQLRELAEHGLAEEMRHVEHARPDRRLFMFYMNNDQARHLHSHFEYLHLSEIEFHTPFFDSDFASTVASMPIEPFLRHTLYNRWMERFHPRAAAFYWQEYPGHLPSPHQRPAGAIYQWNDDWFSGSEIRAAVARIADRVLRDREVMRGGLINPWLLRLARLLNRLGQSRLDYEIEFARRIRELYYPVPNQ